MKSSQVIKRSLVSTAVLSTIIAAQPSAAQSRDTASTETLEQRVQRLEAQLVASERRSDSTLQLVREAADRFNISGYLSAGITASDSDEENYYGIDSDPDTAIDTILGIQMRFAVNEKTDVVAQLTASPAERSSTVSADWAYVSYDATEDLTLRAGRLRIPFFAVSDYLDVGYAYPWVRPPAEVYNVPFDSLEGADIQWRHSLAGYSGLLQLIYGNSDIDHNNPTDTAFELRNIFGANYSLSHNDWTLRLGYYRSSEFSIDKDNDFKMGQLITGLSQTLGYPALESEDLTGTFASVGLSYDDGTMMMMSEFIRQNSSGLLMDKEAFHITTGYRFGDLMPYATFAKYYTVDDEKRHEVSQRLRAVAQAVPASAPGLLALAAGVDGLTEEQESYIAGVRYDVTAGMAVKLEYMYTTGFGDTGGLYESNPGDGVNTYSLVIDTVF